MLTLRLIPECSWGRQAIFLFVGVHKSEIGPKAHCEHVRDRAAIEG